MSELKTLADLISEKRKLEVKALKADIAVLRKSLEIWKALRAYPGLGPGWIPEPPPDTRNSATLVEEVLNGHPLSPREIQALVGSKYNRKLASPTVSGALSDLVRANKALRQGKTRLAKYIRVTAA